MTFLEKINSEHPDLVSNCTDKETGAIRFIFGCPRSYHYESTYSCPKDENGCMMHCDECWNREIPEKQAEPELKIEEEKKVRNLSDVIRDAVLNAINDSDIEYAVKECFENHDYSDMIGRAVENYLYENIEDIADDIVEEAVRDYMRDNL